MFKKLRELMAKKYLTNEKLKTKFKSNFALANYAIKVGREEVLSGKFHTLDELLSEIKKKADNVEDPSQKASIGIK